MAKIQKVPSSLRGHKHFEKNFEPRAIALGPIHHEKPGCELGEEYKQRLADFFIEESGCDKYKMYSVVEKDIENLRACYEDEVTKLYDDGELAWMLFLDGSSLIGFITCMVEGKLEEMNLKNDLAAFGLQDTFLLENQLPCRLLKLLIDQSSNNKERWNANFHVFIDKVRKHTITLEKSRSQKSSLRGNQTESIINDCPHLLHLLRKRILDPMSIDNRPWGGSSFFSKAQRQPSSSSSERRNNLDDDDVEANGPDDSKCCKPVAVICGFFRCYGKWYDDSDDKPTTFRNIKELKSAGIRVRGINSSFLTQIYFKSNVFFPTLYMTSIVVDDWTAPKFLNLVAYEKCPDFYNDFSIASYVCFLASLIHQPEDVKDLRDANILYNVLGSDEEVATLFNEIKTDLVPDKNAYSVLKRRIDRHYNRVWTKLVARGYPKYLCKMIPDILVKYLT